MSKRELKGAEAYCPKCDEPSKYFLPQDQHLCINHGWFDQPLPEESATTQPTLEDEDVSKPQLCSFLLRNRRLCNVEVQGSKFCGYHASEKQKELEQEFKSTILLVLERTLEVSDPDPEILARLHESGFLKNKNSYDLVVPDDYEEGAAFHMLMKIFQELVE